jgi:hypothetical protein
MTTTTAETTVSYRPRTVLLSVANVLSFATLDATGQTGRFSCCKC